MAKIRDLNPRVLVRNVKDFKVETKIKSAEQDKLEKYLHTLESVGFSSLSELGTLTIKNVRNPGNPLLQKPGIVIPQKRKEKLVSETVKSVVSEIREFSKLERGKVISTEIITGDKTRINVVQSANVIETVAPINTSILRSTLILADSYWFGNDIVIADDTEIILDSAVNSIVIIANSLTIGNNVKFTWAKPAYNLKAAKQTPNTPYLQFAKASSVVGERGPDGLRGFDGAKGDDGADAPRVELWFMNLSGRIPNFDLKGQNGEQGQKGGNGGNGGKGQDGCDTKLKSKVPRTYVNKNGSGGDGGRGGQAGNGGLGGDGGNGGQLEVYSTQLLINSVIQNGVTIDISYGSKGVGGEAGTPGVGGNGGSKGHNAYGPLGESGRPNGGNGQGGNLGSTGGYGQDGKTLPDATRFVPITQSEFNIALTKPAIVTTDKLTSYAYVGDTITVTGERFSVGDKVLLEDYGGNLSQECSTTFVSSSTIKFELPNCLGGLISFNVKQSDGTLSINEGTLLVRPKITSIVNGDRVRPGTNIFIKGEGFDRSGQIFLNGEGCGMFKWIDANTIKYKVERPSNIIANEEGENAILKVVNNEGRGPMNYNQSQPHGVVLETFKLCVLGDSHGFGGGNIASDKHAGKIDAYVQSRYKIGSYVRNLAHHGAKIGVGENRSFAPFHGEISTRFPTIIQQVEDVMNAGTTTLCTIAGGANDLPITTFMMNSMPHQLDVIKANLEVGIEQYCYHSMKTLLSDIKVKFPKAKIFVYSYFNFYSDESNPSFMDSVIFTSLMYLGLTDNGLSLDDLIALGVPGVYSHLLNHDKLVTLNKMWVEDSTKWLRKAVEDTNNTDSEENRVFFIDSDTNASHAAFAPNSIVFEPSGGFLNPSDPLKDFREELANDIKDAADTQAKRDELESRGFKKSLTIRNSSFHTNAVGSERYFQKAKVVIDKVLSPVFNVLRTQDGEIVSLDSASTKLIVGNNSVDANAVIDWRDLDNNRLQMKCHNNKFVCAENGGGGPINANRGKPLGWESFTRVDLPNNYFMIKADNGKYFKNNGGIIEATGISNTDAIKFQLL